MAHLSLDGAPASMSTMAEEESGSLATWRQETRPARSSQAPLPSSQAMQLPPPLLPPTRSKRGTKINTISRGISCQNDQKNRMRGSRAPAPKPAQLAPRGKKRPTPPRQIDRRRFLMRCVTMPSVKPARPMESPAGLSASTSDTAGRPLADRAPESSSSAA